MKGWPSTAPRPPDLSVGGWRVGDVTASVEPVIQETEYTSGTEFVLHDKLRTAGWSVRPVQAVVVGHRAGVSEFNEMACAAMGVACEDAQRMLRFDLAVPAMRRAAEMVHHPHQTRAGRVREQRQQQ